MSEYSDHDEQILALQHIILSDYRHLKTAIQELGNMSDVNITPAGYALQLFAVAMMQISSDLAKKYDNRVEVDKLLRELRDQQKDKSNDQE